MSDFSLRRVFAPHDFDVTNDRRGRWIVTDRIGLIGGTFLTERGAVRFARFAAGGDGAHVHIRRGPYGRPGRTRT